MLLNTHENKSSLPRHEPESDLISEQADYFQFLAVSPQPSQFAECNLGLVLTSEEPESVSERTPGMNAPLLRLTIQA